MEDVPPLPISRRQAITLVLGVAVALLLAVRWFGHSAPAATPAPVAVRVQGAARSARPKLVVHVAGAVRGPGLYRLKDGSRVADALARAGGATRKANLEAVNLAAPLVDGEQVLVPRSTPAGITASARGHAAAGPVSLSAATVEQLDELPGVGPVTAQKIVDYRTSHGTFVGRRARCRARYRSGTYRCVERACRAVIARFALYPQHVLLTALCCGVAAANSIRIGREAALFAVVAGVTSLWAPRVRFVLLAVGLALGGLWVGSVA